MSCGTREPLPVWMRGVEVRPVIFLELPGLADELAGWLRQDEDRLKRRRRKK